MANFMKNIIKSKEMEKKIMLEAMKKKAIKSAVVIAVIMFIIGGVVMAVTVNFGFFKSKTNIYSARVSDIRNTDWAKLNIDKYNLYGIFTELYETKNGVKKTTDYYCLVLVGDEDDDQRFMAVKVPAKYKDKLDKIEEEYTDLDNGVESDAHTVIKIQGELKEMNTSSKLYRYFKEFVMGYEYEENEIPLVTLNLCLEPISQTSAIVFFVIAMIFILIGIFVILKAVITGGAGKIKKKMATMNQSDLDHLEYDFQSAYQVNKGFKIGKEFTYVMSGMSGNLIINREIIWAYLNTIEHRRNGIHTGTTYNIILTDINKKTYTISVVNEAEAHEVLDKYGQISNRIVLGYDAELKKLINRDFNGFLNIAYNRVEEPIYDQENNGYEQY